MPSFYLGSLFGRGQIRALADSALPHAPIESHREGRTPGRNPDPGAIIRRPPRSTIATASSPVRRCRDASPSPSRDSNTPRCCWRPTRPCFSGEVVMHSVAVLTDPHLPRRT